MRSVSTILVPIDFSERSAPAARYARTLAAHLGAEVFLLHAVMEFEYRGDVSGTMLDQVSHERVERAVEEMDAFVAAEFPEQIVPSAVVIGDPAGRIIHEANKPGRLILMPTHGYGPFRRFILGSTTAKVLHDADCPVWTGVHLEDAPLASMPPRRVLCAVDLGPQSSKTLCWAAELAAQSGAELTLLHVTLGAADAAREELQRLESFVHAEAEIRIESGDPPAAICAAASNWGADALVVGRGSAAGVFGRLRANAYSIIRQSPCPVVSV